MNLLPEHYPAVITAVWNSRLDIPTRRKFAASSLLVSKQWSSDFARVSEEILDFFCPMYHRDQYLCVSKNARPTEERLKAYKRSISVRYQWLNLNNIVTGNGINTFIDTSVDWREVFSKERFPNLKVLSMESMDAISGFVGMEKDWSWLNVSLPLQVDTLEFVACDTTTDPKNNGDVRPFLVNPEEIPIRCKTIKHLRFFGMENESMAWGFLAPVFPNLETVEVDSGYVVKPVSLKNRLSKEDYYQWTQFAQAIQKMLFPLIMPTRPVRRSCRVFLQRLMPTTRSRKKIETEEGKKRRNEDDGKARNKKRRSGVKRTKFD
ncbi:hypothetical protein BDQ17DRAFT_1328362 [Cyathus striatus]|nr:hypothetical protein BDQ17DRAFT_1328362 [Cyathus striatus]